MERKFLLIGMLFLATTWGCQKSQNANLSEENSLVASVGKVSIMEKEFKDIANRELTSQKNETMNRYSDQNLIHRMVEDEILFQEAKKDKLNDKQNIKQMLVRNATTYISKENAPTISDADVQKYYDAHKEEYLQIRLSHLFIEKNVSEKNPHAAIDLANKVLEELKKGKPFDVMVAKYSKDKRTAKTKGDLGFFSSGRLRPDIWQKIQSIAVGGYSDLVESKQGYHIIKVTEKNYLGLDLVVATIHAKIEREFEEQKKSELVKKLRNEFPIKIDNSLINNTKDI